MQVTYHLLPFLFIISFLVSFADWYLKLFIIPLVCSMEIKGASKSDATTVMPHCVKCVLTHVVQQAFGILQCVFSKFIWTWMFSAFLHRDSPHYSISLITAPLMLL